MDGESAEKFESAKVSKNAFGFKQPKTPSRVNFLRGVLEKVSSADTRLSGAMEERLSRWHGWIAEQRMKAEVTPPPRGPVEAFKDVFSNDPAKKLRAEVEDMRRAMRQATLPTLRIADELVMGLRLYLGAPKK